MGPIHLSLPPLAQTSSYATGPNQDILSEFL